MMSAGADSFKRSLNRFGHSYAPMFIEFIGTYFLVLVASLAINDSSIGGTSVASLAYAPFAIGSILMVLVFLGGHISGGHYNPAVSFGVFCTGRGKMSFGSLLAYWFVQFTGGFLAAWVGYGLRPEGFGAPYPKAGADFSNFQAIVAELMFTFVLVSVVLNVATTESQKDNSFFGLGIGFTIIASGYAIGPISGAVLNPAVGFGLTLVANLFESDSSNFKDLYMYFLAPLLGGFLAAVIFRITNPKEFDDETSNDTDPYRSDQYLEMDR
jgi:aquaporin Z